MRGDVIGAGRWNASAIAMARGFEAVRCRRRCAVSGDIVVAGAFGAFGVFVLGFMYLSVGHLTPWTIVPFRICDILKAVEKGWRAGHFRIREDNSVRCGRFENSLCFIEVHCVIGNGRISRFSDGAKDRRSILVLV